MSDNMTIEEAISRIPADVRRLWRYLGDGRPPGYSLNLIDKYLEERRQAGDHQMVEAVTLFRKAFLENLRWDSPLTSNGNAGSEADGRLAASQPEDRTNMWSWQRDLRVPDDAPEHMGGAGLVSSDPELYEASNADWAGRYRKEKKRILEATPEPMPDSHYTPSTIAFGMCFLSGFVASFGLGAVILARQPSFAPLAFQGVALAVFFGLWGRSLLNRARRDWDHIESILGHSSDGQGRK